MKKKAIVVMSVVLVAVLVAAGVSVYIYSRPVKVEIDYNNCTAYSKEDIDMAAEEVIKKVKTFEGELPFDRAVLYSLKVDSTDCLDYCRSLNVEADYTESLVFSSVMRSPVTGGGGWNSNSIYHWNWYPARTDGGEWELLTWGYG